MNYPAYLVRGKLAGTHVLQSFVDLKSSVRWCTHHKGADANFQIECDGVKIATITYKKPFHVITSENG